MEDSIFLNNESNKTTDFKKNESLNDIIAELTVLLKPVQLEIQNRIESPEFPVGLIIGSPRSGTTLLLQWLASLGHFSYPTNLINRFAYAPYIGAQIQKMLFNPDYDFSGEFSDINSDVNFNSNLGKSQGALATNEFQHFFRNYMPNFDPEYLNRQRLNQVDFTGIKKGIATLELAFNKPFVTKAVMLQYNLLEVYQQFPKAFSLYIKRNPSYNMQSIFSARQKYYDDVNIWWSVKPKEYAFLKDMDVYHQIAGQVFYTNQSINKALTKIPRSNYLTIEYEEFCKNPEVTYNNIIAKYALNNYKVGKKYSGESFFNVSNELKIKKEEIKALEKAYSYFESTE